MKTPSATPYRWAATPILDDSLRNIVGQFYERFGR